MIALEVFGTCLDCGESSTAFPDVVRRLENGRCSVCGSESIAGAHTVPPTSWGGIIDTRFFRGQRYVGKA